MDAAAIDHERLLAGDSASAALAHWAARSARVNHLYTFAWICALVLPAVLQYFAGTEEDIRDYLGEYYGLPTLYFFFSSTYGFATVFIV
jgi:hypothetical protein